MYILQLQGIPIHQPVFFGSCVLGLMLEWGEPRKKDSNNTSITSVAPSYVGIPFSNGCRWNFHSPRNNTVCFMSSDHNSVVRHGSPWFPRFKDWEALSTTRQCDAPSRDVHSGRPPDITEGGRSTEAKDG